MKLNIPAIAIALLHLLSPSSAQEVKLSASDWVAEDDFAYGVSLDGGMALMGAPRIYPDGEGTAYLFDADHSSSTFGQQLVELQGSNTYYASFGYSVSLADDLAAVATLSDGWPGQGAVYIFDVNPSSSAFGTELMKITDSTNLNTMFGASVSLSDGVLLVGSRDHTDYGFASAYDVDPSSSSSGSRISLFSPSDGHSGDYFGTCVSLDGDYALIGASWHRVSSGTSSMNFVGAAYLFEVDPSLSTNNLELIKLQASDWAQLDYFGEQVALDGGLALIGAPGNDDHGYSSGSAYLFDVNPSSATFGSELLKLTASDAASWDNFGKSVSIDGGLALVGAWQDDDNGFNSGSVYVFDVDPLSATFGMELEKITAFDGIEGDHFGYRTSLDDGLALIGTPMAVTGTESAYLIRCDGHPNDECHDPSLISGQGTFSFDTTGSSTNSSPATTGIHGQDEALCSSFGTSAMNNDIWFSWTADETGLATISFCNGGTTMDTKVAAWPNACPPVAGSALACDDDTCSTQSEIQFDVTAGSEYLIQVGAFGSLTLGSGTFEISIQEPITAGSAYCFGDGTGAPCPCGNTGASGKGCANSASAGAVLSTSGSNSISADDLVLISRGLPPGPGLFFQGDNAVNSGIGSPFGDGLRCVGGSVVRIEVRFSLHGISRSTTSIATSGGVSAGETKRYQHWYRDTPPAPCNSGFNLSNGYEITWTP